MKEWMRRHKKLTGFAILCLVCLCCYAFDAIWAGTYTIEVVSITPETPYADSRQPVEIVLRLTHFGEPVEGHELYALPQNGGTMMVNVIKTDSEGLAVYTYYPYNETSLMKAQPVNVYVHDENNSFIFEVNASLEFVIPLQSPPEEAAS